MILARKPFDPVAYRKIVTEGPCFICACIKGNPEYFHHIVYEDAESFAFLNKYPSLLGHVLVCPRQHKEQVTGDFSPEEYLRLQGVIYRIAEGVRRALPAERVYVISFGSQQGNRHVHWHVVPLPPGIPYGEQECSALSLRDGTIDLPEKEWAVLAKRIAKAMPPKND